MRVAIYCRLSREDEGTQQESESIQNQRSMLVQYAVEQGWEIYQIYCDEDYSGVDRERPGFCALIKAAEQGEFQIVLCKTQSRFTRDMELVERYLHSDFPRWGIRFVAVVDHVDTQLQGNKKARQINGLINEWYLEDLSENIRAVFHHKRQQGQYIGGFPIYGYVLDQAHKLVVEPQGAAVVRQIYALYLAGNGKQHIATVLNAQGIPNPTQQKQQLGMGYRNGFTKDAYGLWNRTTVGRILGERMYTGDLIQGKRKKVSYKSKATVPVPESGWYITQNAHDAIIDQDTFAAVQRMLGERTRTDGSGELHPLAGKVQCMACGSTLAKVSHSAGGIRRSYLRCKLYATDKSRCTKHSIRLDILEEQVLTQLRGYIQQVYDPSRIERLLQASPVDTRRETLEQEGKHLSNQLDRRSKALRDLYLDKSQGVLEESQFAELNGIYLGEKHALQARLDALQRELAVLDKGDSAQQQKAWLEEALACNVLTRELVVYFVDFIQVGECDPATQAQAVAIHWLF